MASILAKVTRNLLVLMLLPAFVVQAQTQPNFVGGWGGLTNPSGIAVDNDAPMKGSAPSAANGNTYVCDTGAHRVVKYSGSGAFITTWGGFGTGIGQLINPRGIRVTRSGAVFVADTGNNRIQRFTSNGLLPFVIGAGFGAGDGQFNQPQAVGTDQAGNIYVADTGNNRIQKFSSNGTFILKWGAVGIGAGQFNAPAGITVDRFANVYVADTGNNRLQKFNSSGTFIQMWGGAGVLPGQFNAMKGISVDIDEPTKPTLPGTESSGNLYVADTGNNRIQKFTTGGVFITSWGTAGSGSFQFSGPEDVAVNNTGDVYVADTGNNRVQHYTFDFGIPLSTPWTLTILATAFATLGALWFGKQRTKVTTVARPRS